MKNFPLKYLLLAFTIIVLGILNTDNDRNLSKRLVKSHYELYLLTIHCEDGKGPIIVSSCSPCSRFSVITFSKNTLE